MLPGWDKAVADSYNDLAKVFKDNGADLGFGHRS